MCDFIRLCLYFIPLVEMTPFFIFTITNQLRMHVMMTTIHCFPHFLLSFTLICISAPSHNSFPFALQCSNSFSIVVIYVYAWKMMETQKIAPKMQWTPLSSTLRSIAQNVLPNIIDERRDSVTKNATIATRNQSYIFQTGASNEMSNNESLARYVSDGKGSLIAATLTKSTIKRLVSKNHRFLKTWLPNANGEDEDVVHKIIWHRDICAAQNWFCIKVNIVIFSIKKYHHLDHSNWQLFVSLNDIGVWNTGSSSIVAGNGTTNQSINNNNDNIKENTNT